MGQVGRLGPKVGGHLALLLHSSRDPGELSQCSKHDDSTINIVVVIIIRPIIIIIDLGTGCVPRTRLRTIGDRAFPVAAARTWNSLPPEVTSSRTLSSLKSELKTYLFKLSFPHSDSVK